MAGVAAIALLVCGCSSDDEPASSTSSTSEAADDGTVGREPGPIELSVGERATIELEANPTTGYRLEPASEPDSSVIHVVSDEYRSASSDAVGAGGTQVMVIEGVAAGTTTLDLRYVRPWEDGGEPAETAAFEVTVT